MIIAIVTSYTRPYAGWSVVCHNFLKRQGYNDFSLLSGLLLNAMYITFVFCSSLMDDLLLDELLELPEKKKR